MGAATILLEVHSFGMQLTNHTHIDLLLSKYLYISVYVYMYIYMLYIHHWELLSKGCMCVCCFGDLYHLRCNYVHVHTKKRGPGCSANVLALHSQMSNSCRAHTALQLLCIRIMFHSMYLYVCMYTYVYLCCLLRICDYSRCTCVHTYFCRVCYCIPLNLELHRCHWWFNYPPAFFLRLSLSLPVYLI